MTARPSRSPILPPPVGHGALLGVAALSGRVDGERLEGGLDALRRLGYRLRLADNLKYQCGMFAGDDAQRLDGFHRLAEDPEVEAIVFARGGHGVLRILPQIDWQLLARRPRAYVGYSDLAPFLLQVVQRLGWVAFHGPMVAADFARGLEPQEVTSFQRALAGEWPQDLSLAWASAGEPCEGPLLGGCLSMLEAVLGTPYATDFNGAILFLEDLNEAPYRFDRMLTHLRLSGSLTHLKAVIAGHLVGDGQKRPDDSEVGERDPNAHPDAVRLREVLWDLSGHFDWPWAWGLKAGHARPNLTLPIGMWSRLDPAAQTLRLGLA